MDDSPFRRRGPNNRTNRSSTSSQAARNSEDPKLAEIADDQPLQTRHNNQATADKPRRKKPVAAIVSVIVLVIIALVAGWFARGFVSSAPKIDASKYQAVSFTNGQLYFGKLTSINDQYFKLSDIYYLQPQTNDKSAKDVQKATAGNNFKLVKYADVIYSPENSMVIPKNQVLFYDNLKPDGKVAKLIQQDKSNN